MPTTVLYPRFQYEDNPELDIWKRELKWNAEEHDWVDRQEWYQITHPVISTAEYRKNIKGKWWGVYHHGREVTSLGRLFDNPFESNNPFRLFRTIITHHVFCWDEQAMTGSATEVVLEQLTDQGFSEQAAILSSDKGTGPNQRLVLATERGWVEPAYDGIDDRRDFCLLVMAELAVATHDDIISSAEKIR